MKRIAAIALALATLPAGAAALPQYAAQEQKQCLHCHVDPGGGGARNFRGQYFEAHDFSFAGFDEKTAAGGSGGGNSALETLLEALSFSGEMRALYSVAEGPHASLGSGCESCHAPGQRAPDNSFFLMQGEIGVSARISEKLSFRYSNDLGITRDVYATMRFRDGSTFVKVGAFEVPYGLENFADHNALVKVRHNVGSNLRDVGVQGAIQTARYFASVAVVNGRPRFSQSPPVFEASIDQDGTPAIALRAGVNTPRGRFGASVLHDNSGRGNATRETFGGAFGSVYLGPWRFHGEVDFGQERFGMSERSNLGFLAQGTLKVLANTEISARYDRYDPDTDFDEDGESWYSLIAEHHLSQNASLQGRLRLRDEEYETLGSGASQFDVAGNDDALLMLYVHF